VYVTDSNIVVDALSFSQPPCSRPPTITSPPCKQVYVTDSNIVVDAPELVKGKRVVLIEDGPTLTHGGMAYGAGKVGERGCRVQAAGCRV